MSALLQIDQICKTYDKVPVARNISFSLEQGEILCLLGPSGSGKTTLLRLLAGLETADKGSLLFNGLDIAGIAPHKRHFGMMFQEYALFPHKNVADNICFGLEMKKWPKGKQQQRIREMLELVGLGDKEKRRIDELSGGERQRVALARSLAPQPQLLLLDEPLGSLDRVLRDRLAGEIRTILKKQKVTAVFVTHDQSEAFAVADQIAILQDGRLEQFAAPEEIYRRPANRNVAAFLGFRNLIDCADHPLKNLFTQEPESCKGFAGLLLIRPEAARVASDNSKNLQNGWPQIQGMVKKRLFQGQVYAMTIEAQNKVLHFEVPIDPAPPAIGAAILLDINPSAMVQLNGGQR